MSDQVIAVDAMGGDLGVHQSVPAIKQALSVVPEQKFILTGEQRFLEPVLAQHKLLGHSGICVIDAPCITSHQAPILELLRRHRRNRSSMWTALEQVRCGEASACVSAGNTSVLLVLSKHAFGLIDGVMRPALIAELPNQRGYRTAMLDLGANLACSDALLKQLAWMGYIYAREVLHLAQPRIALLNIGEEHHKGHLLLRQVSEYLHACPLSYQGFVEGDRLFSGENDVIVCDGFAGNIALKTAEGVARLLIDSSESKLFWRWLRRWLLKRKLKHWDPDHYNGACLLGLRKTVIKSHGKADKHGFCHAILRAEQMLKQNLTQKMTKQFAVIDRDGQEQL